MVLKENISNLWSNAVQFHVTAAQSALPEVALELVTAMSKERDEYLQSVKLVTILWGHHHYYLMLPFGDIKTQH